MSESTPPAESDVVVVDAGFARSYAMHRLRGPGFMCRADEAAADVGGGWNRNRYPGAPCDFESLQSPYSFSKELEQERQWSERYAFQLEMLDCINPVAELYKTRACVRDPEAAEPLTPRDHLLGSKRTCVDADYFGASKKYQAVGTHAESQEVVK